MTEIPAGKTPISFLQEYATKHAITPQYDLVANEGAVHEPTFIMRVTVGDKATATGKGSSKKKAKHHAAQNALNIIMGTTNGEEETEVKTEADNESKSPSQGKGNDVGNPIGDLQEFTQKKLIKPPIYEFLTEQGSPVAREFTCTIKLGKFVDKGTGPSKKAAKRTAAANMLAQLSKVDDKPEQLEESDDEEDITLGFGSMSMYGRLRQSKKHHGGSSVSPKSALEIQRFYEKVMAAGGKQVPSAGQTSRTPPTNYCQMLQEIAEVQRFEVQYFDIKEEGTADINQCLVQMSTVPIAVCQGTGPIMDEAHANAAHNALQYLRIMIK